MYLEYWKLQVFLFFKPVVATLGEYKYKYWVQLVLQIVTVSARFNDQLYEYLQFNFDFNFNFKLNFRQNASFSSHPAIEYKFKGDRNVGAAIPYTGNLSALSLKDPTKNNTGAWSKMLRTTGLVAMIPYPTRARLEAYASLPERTFR